MKKCVLLILVISLWNHAVKANEANDKFNQEIRDSITSATKANDEITDEALLAYLKRMLKYMPEEWDKLQLKESVEKTRILQNFRDFHSQSGLSIADMIKLFDESPEFEEMMAQTWAEDTLGVEYAESVLMSLSKAQYQDIMNSAKVLIKNNQSKEVLTVKYELPNALSFLEIEQIRVSNNHCDIYLYKGIGSMKSIGFTVKQEKDGSWELSHFNYLKSYEHVVIDLN